MINKSGLIVTFGASDMLVAGSPPRVHIGRRPARITKKTTMQKTRKILIALR
jgi:hypothetical protein